MRKTGGLFNRYGYRATPMSAVMKATGLKKGGLYNHFRSKKELALETFRFNLSAMGSFLSTATSGTDDPVQKLRRLLAASLGVAAGEAVPGGCPVLNAAVEADDAFPALRNEVVVGAENLRGRISELLAQARDSGRIRADEDIDALSFFFLAALEGGIMLAKLHGDSHPLAVVVDSLNRVIDSVAPGPE
jgi:TetR/AcrR family transcriptional regulator, transcriptional repressor for nem operon